MRADIVLVGYYGRGNFGDDILLMVSWSIVAERFPEARVAVRLPDGEDYLPWLLGDAVERVSFGSRDQYSLIVHGGGGVFFDFRVHSFGRRFKTHCLLAGGGRNYVVIDKAVRSLVARPRMTALKRIGFGLGVGRYSSGSPKLLDALPILHDFDRLWLRDKQSERNLSRIGVEVSTFAGTDLAFLAKRWCPEGLYLGAKANANSIPQVALVLRDWGDSQETERVRNIKRVVSELSGVVKFTLVSLDPKEDQRALESWGELPCLVWRPRQNDLGEFLRSFATHDAFVTMRAHGAICGACMGLPGVIINVEPKLESVHAMLPSSTRLVPGSAEPSLLVPAIWRVLEIKIAAIVSDVTCNARQAELSCEYACEGL